jgi:ankyrin repeat protein
LYRSGAKIDGDFLASDPRIYEIVVQCCGHVDAVKCLAESGVDVLAILGPTALHHARDADTAKYLVQLGAELHVDENGRMPLHAKDMNIRLIDFLIEIGADVNATCNAGMTPLHYALDGAQISSLIEHKADVCALDNTSKTPLHYPMRYAYSVREFLEKGADIEAVDEQGRTPFMAVVLESIYPSTIAKELVRNGANPNAVDSKGQTALHNINAGSYYAIEDLVKMKADPSIRDNDGKTALDLATDAKVIRELKRAMGYKK